MTNSNWSCKTFELHPCVQFEFDVRINYKMQCRNQMAEYWSMRNIWNNPLAFSVKFCHFLKKSIITCRQVTFAQKNGANLPPHLVNNRIILMSISLIYILIVLMSLALIYILIVLMSISLIYILIVLMSLSLIDILFILT